VDFGFASTTEWFEAYALRPPDAAADPPSAHHGSTQAFLRAHHVACGLKPLESRRRSVGLIPTLPPDSGSNRRTATGPGLGLRLVPRPLEAHVLTALDDRRARGPRVWSIDAGVGSGWRTSWCLIAREARLRGYVPVHAGVLESAVRRQDGRHTSWLALLDGSALLVLHERADWQVPDRQGLARLLVRLGGGESAGSVVLDVVRRGRPRPAAHTLEALPVEQLAGALWVSPGCCSPQWLRARAAAASANGLPGPFVARVAMRLGLRTDVPTVHERAPAFAETPRVDSGTEIDPTGTLEKAKVLASAGRTAAAQRHVQRAAWALARRRAHLGCARLLVEASRLAASRGDLRQSRHCWREAGRLAPAAHAASLVDGAADVAEQWIRQAALADAEYLLHSALGASRVLDAQPPPRLIALLATCLCWQARWAEALGYATSDRAAVDAQIAMSRVWPRLELRDIAGGMADLRAAASRCGPGDAAVAQLRIDVASGSLNALMSAAHTHADAPVSALSLADDDRLLVPAEGLIKHGIALPEPLLRRLRALTRRDVARLVRARARLILALASARDVDRPHIEDDVARVARGTDARALVAGQALVSAWPTLSDEGNQPMLDDLVAVLRACQAHDDPRAALPSVCQLLHTRLHGSAVLVSGVSAHGTIALARLGQRELTAIAERAAHLGQSVVACESGATDCAMPVRLGEAVIGALACHWAMPESRLDPSHRTLLEAAAIAVAPTVRLAVELANRPAVRPETSSLLGASQAMAEIRAAVEAASRVPFTVLVDGESGSGKELVAREIHRLGPRRSRPFCAVNCAALTDDLCEAELFGHARGAFTGAVGERAGLFEDADGGTLFLDEVSELSPRAQAKLLRAIQEGEIRRLGETRSRRVDVRLVAATNRPLADAVAAGAFRADLRYRLDVVHITLPPLRDRPDDVPLLARHFWERATQRVDSHARLAPETLAALARYDWPGNVRELQNALSALAVYAPRHGVVRVSALPAAIGGGTPLGGVTLEQARRLVDERLVRAALAQTGGHRGRAASALGLTRQGFAKLVDRLHLESGSDRAAPAS
jgi:transcriptional regulator with GAF, ATPase, and Fis domain